MISNFWALWAQETYIEIPEVWKVEIQESGWKFIFCHAHLKIAIYFNVWGSEFKFLLCIPFLKLQLTIKVYTQSHTHIFRATKTDLDNVIEVIVYKEKNHPKIIRHSSKAMFLFPFIIKLSNF